ncbi:AAA family ATPase [Thiomicrorhabdus sp. ZW0627]|uniref:ExeA family protein n=1 Tax=Thiomicrorhabdus sp. ZW0627 TaxID=3039774 RepID=UPI0024363A12|nr:AAA family ATPase [Thiomicrorhabdus sp. ZW0627]MDG6773936.1 AAA family ATPase [Thiomicrorhabdus sp. ZW0627]
MYRSHFGLKQLPFKNSPDLHFFYEQASRIDILNALLYVIRRGDPIIKVTGEVGCGKTTLLRLLANSLESNFQIVYINSPNLSPKDLLFHIADELSVIVKSDLPKYSLLKLLRERLLELHGSGRQVVMLVDEAQAMSVDTLEEIRLLSNIETDVDKLIQIVLFGQPELDIALQNHDLRQLKDRISYHMHVPALTPDEVKSYLNYRMRQASYKGLDFFDTKFSRQIHKLSSGLPRSINTIADQLLMAVYGTGDSRLKRKHFKNISPENLVPDRRQSIAILLTLLVLISITVFGVYRFENVIVNFLTDKAGYIRVVDSIGSLESAPVEQFTSVASNNQLNADITQINDKVPSNNVILRKGGSETDNELVDPVLNKLARLLPSAGDLSEEVLKTLISEHEATEEWLKTFESSSYLIQLSTSTVAGYPKASSIYNNHKMLSGKIHVMLDLNSNTDKYRVKFLYLQSNSYSYLMQKLSVLPSSLKKSQPFITPVKHLLKSLETTKQSLN